MEQMEQVTAGAAAQRAWETRRERGWREELLEHPAGRTQEQSQGGWQGSVQGPASLCCRAGGFCHVPGVGTHCGDGSQVLGAAAAPVLVPARGPTAPLPGRTGLC